MDPRIKQTKQSFEHYLRVNRDLAKGIQLPLVDSVDCPICGVPAMLTEDDIEHKIDEHTWKGTHYFYKCPKCDEQFTTTDSDGLSIASFQLVEPNTNA